MTDVVQGVGERCLGERWRWGVHALGAGRMQGDGLAIFVSAEHLDE